MAIRFQPQRLGELGFGTFMHADLCVLGAEQVADVSAFGRLLPSPLQAVERDIVAASTGRFEGEAEEFFGVDHAGGDGWGGEKGSAGQVRRRGEHTEPDFQ